jgi:hypothetical protein
MMFGKKKGTENMMAASDITFGESYCVGCGCLLKRGKECVVCQNFSQRVTYCGRCKPPYDHLSWTEDEIVYHRDVPATRIRVNEDGSEYKEPKS